MTKKAIAKVVRWRNCKNKYYFIKCWLY